MAGLLLAVGEWAELLGGIFSYKSKLDSTAVHRQDLMKLNFQRQKARGCR
jgi:hypothetical protein